MAPRGSGTCGSLSRVGLGSGRRRARYALEGPFIRSTMRRCGVDEPAGARAGHRQIRQRAHRNERTARYNPGGGAELAKIGKPDSFPITAADHSHLRPVTLSPSKVRTSCATSCPHATALRVTGVSPERTAAQPAPRSPAAPWLTLLRPPPRGAEPARHVRAIRAARRRDRGRGARPACQPCPQRHPRSPARAHRAVTIAAG